MRLLVSVDRLAASLLAALVLVPLSGCGSSSTGGAGGSGGKGPNLSCEAPKPSGNLVACAAGWNHRAAADACTIAPSPGVACTLSVGPDDPPAECMTDAECTAKPNGRCGEIDDGGESYRCGCTYACAVDADCAAGEICFCGAAGGSCLKAGCKIDADCGPGLLCAGIQFGTGECAELTYQCQSAADECMVDEDCSTDDTYAECTYDGTHRICGGEECGIGRPFLVDGRGRLSPTVPRADWHAHGLAPDLDGLDAPTRGALAARWAGMGSMEHASIAAFARFVLQLLSLGAPPDLIRAAQTAMADETRHAEICYALASAYAGAAVTMAVGPGPLDIEGALASNDAHTILVTAIHEGCVGETVAALEAAEMAARAQDPAVRALLEEIAADEARHAELAYRFVQWAVDAIPDLAPTARHAFEDALAARPRAESHAAWALAAHGFAGDGLRREIRAQALTGAVGPCAHALLAQATMAA